MGMKQLRHGYTTGACAAAAAKGAAQMLRDQQPADEVELILPTGEAARFRLHGQRFSAAAASCYVVKDAGDDPDITNGAAIHATVRTEECPASRKERLVIEGGRGVGRVTKPGLAVAVGEWAINPVPRRMIRHAVNEVLAIRCLPVCIRVAITIPDGEELAKKTLNARLGIVGGLSILGTTGIVRPVSVSAWTDCIDCAIDVALACGAESVVFATGRSSELAAQQFLAKLREESYVMMGDHVGHALRSARDRGVKQAVIAGQFAKLLKIACGHENTHAAASELDLTRLLEWSREAGLPQAILDSISSANTAREIAIACSFDAALLNEVFRHAHMAGGRHAPGVSAHFLVADYSGNCIFNSLTSR